MVFLIRKGEAFEITEDAVYHLTARRIDEGDGELYDVSNMNLFPAFIDTHTHLIGRYLLDLDVSGRKDKQEILKAIERVLEKEDEAIVYGRDETVIGEPIEPEDLNFDKPVLAIRVDGHMGVINEATKRVYSIDKDKLYEDDLYELLQRMKAKKNREPAVKKALKAMKEKGVIHVGEISKDLFTIRIAAQMKFPAEFLLEALDEAEEAKGYVKWFKVYADGSLGSHTAALRDPYRDDPSNYGKLLLTHDEIHELALKAEKLGFGLAVHAIGDKAIDEVLDGFKGTKTKNHRVEHFLLAHEEQIEEAAKLRIWLSVQPNFVYQRGQLNGMYHKRLGPERLMRILPLDEMLAYRTKFAFGSDCMPFDPIVGLKGAVEHPFHPIGLEDAIERYTTYAAKLLKIDYPWPAIVAMDGDAKLTIYRGEVYGSLKPVKKVILGAKHKLDPKEFIKLVSSKISLRIFIIGLSGS